MNASGAKPLTIIARIQAKPGCEATVGIELHKLLEPSRRDPGCLNYDMHVDLETPGLYLFHENWRRREDWEAHMETPHLQAWRAVADDLVAEFELLQMKNVD